MFIVMRKSNVGDLFNPVELEAALESFDTRKEAEQYIVELIKLKPYLKYDRLYIKEVE